MMKPYQSLVRLRLKLSSLFLWNNEYHKIFFCFNILENRRLFAVTLYNALSVSRGKVCCAGMGILLSSENHWLSMHGWLFGSDDITILSITG